MPVEPPPPDRTGQKLPRGIGVAWYRREDWDALMRLFSDPELQPKDYDTWLALAEKAIADLRAEGVEPIRALVEPVHFRAWCLANKMDFDSRARSRYASEIARRTKPRKPRPPGSA
jgi:hypothetical protein